MKKIATLLMLIFLLTATIQIFPANSIDLGSIFESLKSSTISASKCSNGSCSSPSSCSGGNCAASGGGDFLSGILGGGDSGGSGG